jgi:hypothetical protein
MRVLGEWQKQRRMKMTKKARLEKVARILRLLERMEKTADNKDFARKFRNLCMDHVHQMRRFMEQHNVPEEQREQMKAVWLKTLQAS